MEIVIAAASIFILTAAVRLAGKLLPVKVCPICAGVSLTWLWILTGIYLGKLEALLWMPIAAVALGGSVVGIAYQLEKRLPRENNSWRTPLLWKSLFIPPGFAAAYGLAAQSWIAAAAGAALAAIAASVFFARRTQSGPKDATVADLEEKMKECC